MKQKILDIAAQMIQQYGLKKFTVDEIAVRLKISKKTIYRYFRSKDEIISEYFETVVSSDKSSVLKALDENDGILEKIQAIVHSTHKYRLPVLLLNETKMFYPDEWQKIENLKTFKVDVTRKLLEQGACENILKANVNLAVLSKMLQEIGDMFIDYDFLLENRLKTTEAIDKALEIILYGIVK